jgi:hypothetical protein
MDLMDLVTASAPEAVLEALAGSLGQSTGATRKALVGGAMPAVLLGMIARFGQDPASAGKLLGLLRRHVPGGAPDEDLLASMLGERSDAVADVLAGITGTSRQGATSMLSAAAFLAVNAIGRHASAVGLDAAGLATMLQASRDSLQKLAPRGIAEALGLADVIAPPGAARKGAIWPWLAVPAITLLMAFTLHTCQQRAPAPLPDGSDLRPPG